VAVESQRTVGQNAWAAALGTAGLCLLVLVLAVVLGLVGGLAWSLFQTMWGVFG
jgi:hypothetical protein